MIGRIVYVAVSGSIVQISAILCLPSLLMIGEGWSVDVSASVHLIRFMMIGECQSVDMCASLFLPCLLVSHQP